MNTSKVKQVFAFLITLVVLVAPHRSPAQLPMLVKDINPGGGTSFPFAFTDVNGTIFFGARDASGNRELWKTDGTAAGTKLVKDINPTGSSNPSFLTNLNGTLLFTATDGVTGFEVWKSDGTEGGTVLVKDIRPGPSGSSTFPMVSLNGSVLFTADDGTVGREL